MKCALSLIAVAIIIGFLPNAAHAQPRLSLGSLTAEPGDSLILPLKLVNGDQPYAGVNAKIYLPDGISVTDVLRGDLLSADFSVARRSFADQTGSGVAVLTYSRSGTIAAGNGVLLQITISVDSGISQGTFPITFATTNINPLINARYALSNLNGSESVSLSVLNGSINIDDTGGNGGVLPGDIDGDDAITLADAILALKVGSGMDLQTISLPSGADVNGDQRLGIEEAIYVLQAVAGLRE